MFRLLLETPLAIFPWANKILLFSITFSSSVTLPCRFRAGIDVQRWVCSGEPSPSCGFQAAAGGELWHLPEPEQATATDLAQDGHWHGKLGMEVGLVPVEKLASYVLQHFLLQVPSSFTGRNLIISGRVWMIYGTNVVFPGRPHNMGNGWFSLEK